MSKKNFKYNNNEYKNEYKIEEKNLGLATAGLVLGIISLFLFPGLGILSIVFGAIAINTNTYIPNDTKINRAVKYGRTSIILGIIDIIWMCLLYFQIFSY